MCKKCLKLPRALSENKLAVRVAIFALLACLAFARASAEQQSVYLIASEPYERLYSEGFPTLLYRLEDSRLVKIRTVTTQRQDTLFVDVFPGRGFALVGSDRSKRLGSFLLDVIDMDSVSRQKSFEIDLCEGCSYLGSHMQDRHGAQAYFLRSISDGRIYRGVDLTTGQILSDFDWTDEANAYRTGTGSSFVDRLDRFRALIHGSELFNYGGESLRRYELGWQLPEGMGWELGSVVTEVLVNNDDTRMISVYQESEWIGEVQDTGLYVLDKAANEWSKLNVPSGMGSFRAFGHWLVREDIQSYRPGALNLVRYKRHWAPPFLSAAERFELRRLAPSGRLYFYDARTKELIVHDTGEPDTEALYVDGDDVAWYRVSDELRRARIEGGKLGAAEVVARAPEMWAVHWLFFGKE